MRATEDKIIHDAEPNDRVANVEMRNPIIISVITPSNPSRTIIDTLERLELAKNPFLHAWIFCVVPHRTTKSLVSSAKIACRLTLYKTNGIGMKAIDMKPSKELAQSTPRR